MDSLPDWVLTQIFEKLPLPRRNQIRLVCQRWNRACNAVSITRREELVIQHVYKARFTSIFETLMSSKRSVLNLKFCSQEILFYEESGQMMFWQRLGAKVGSLVFDGCTFERNAVIKILNCCEYVTGLSFTHCEDTLLLCINELMANRIVQTSVRHFELMLANFHHNIVGTIPIVFPNIRELTISIGLDWPVQMQVARDRQLPVADTIKLISSLSNRMEKLKLYFLPYEASVDCGKEISNALTAFKMLKTLQIGGLLYQAPRESLDRICSNVQNVTTFSFDAQDCSYPFHDLFARILDSLPNLRHLELIRFLLAEINEAIILKIMASSLKTLKLMHVTAKSVWHVGHNMAGSITPNVTLEEITISGRTDLKLNLGDAPLMRLCQIFVRHCTKLRNISISCPTNRLLQDILQFQKRLRSLTLELGLKYELTDDGFGGTQIFGTGGPNSPRYSIGCLEELEHLKVIIHLDRISKSIFSDLTLLNVKYLNVHVLLDWPPTEATAANFLLLMRSIEDMPKLEFLKVLYQDAVPFDVFLGQCQMHENLQYLSFTGCQGNQFSFSDYEKLFQMNCSLRFVTHNGIGLYKNVISKKVQKVSPGYMHCLCAPKVGYERIGWIS